MRFVLPLNLRKLHPLGSVRLAAILLSSLFLVNPAWADPGESREKKAPEAAQQNPFGKPANPAADDDPFGAAVGDPFADTPVATTPRPKIVKSTRSPSQRVRDELNRETKISFIDTPLEEVVSYLNQLHDVQFVLDKAAFMEAGIENDDPLITANAEGITMADGLDIMLLGTGLHYQNRGSWLLITTEAGINKWIGEQLAKETRISFNQTPMLQALATLSQIHHIPIDVEISTVASHPAFTQGKVTMQQDRITLDAALTQILEEHDLRYERRDRGLWVTGN